jgi:hypothetical protein
VVMYGKMKRTVVYFNVLLRHSVRVTEEEENLKQNYLCLVLLAPKAYDKI